MTRYDVISAPWLRAIGVCFLAACATPPDQTFQEPSEPIRFSVNASARDATFVKDHRSNDQRITKAIRESYTTTLIVGDDILEPAAPRILASKIVEQSGLSDWSMPVDLRMFVISVSGRSPPMGIQASVPIVSPYGMLWIPMTMPAQSNADVHVPPPPSGYSADLLSVAISGEFMGTEFSASETARLDGRASASQIRELVELVSTDAARKVVQRRAQSH